MKHKSGVPLKNNNIYPYMPYPPPGDKKPRFSTMSPYLPPWDRNPPIFKNSTNKKIKASFLPINIIKQ
jgi:hypothetical protein